MSRSLFRLVTCSMCMSGVLEKQLTFAKAFNVAFLPHEVLTLGQPVDIGPLERLREVSVRDVWFITCSSKILYRRPVNYEMLLGIF